MKHTRGTWYASGSINIHEQRIIADEETGQTIAVCYGRGEHDSRESETEANAHLIAAAPDLLEACKYALSVLESIPEEYCEVISDILDESIDTAMIELAINKAEGK